MSKPKLVPVAHPPEGLPFATAEYHGRRERLRAAMIARGIDLLLVTSPANLYYLTGYAAIWYPPRLPLAAVFAAVDSQVLFIDWSRHLSYVSQRVLCDAVLLIDYGSAPATVATFFAQRGWGACTLGIEWSSPTPSASVITELTERLRHLGARIVSADWLVDQLRLYKSAAELLRLREAAAIADDAMLQLQRDLRPGMTALAVSARLAQLLADRGSEIPATAPLVNAGPTAYSETHALPSRRTLESGDVVAVDCCAVVDRYHANLARTFSIGTPNALAAQFLEHAGGSILEFQRRARSGEGPETAMAAAERYVRERVPSENIWWIGGYALGIAFAPSWVGHTYLANDGPERCSLMPGYVSNYENVFFDQQQGFEAAYIDTIVMTAQGLEVLSGLPRGLLPGGG
jgi:Xaa-Pro aminopeptidase